MKDKYHVYFLSNYKRTVLYTGLTNNLIRRLAEHRIGTAGAFTKRYKLRYLVHFETFDSPHAAIQREKQIKGWKREKKLRLVLSSNPIMKDLSQELQ